MLKEKKQKKLQTLEERLNTSTYNPMDVYIGSRLRLRRTLLGISQDQLAEEMNVSFQQIQKYEKGINRIGAGRLWELAKLLSVPVNYFYENLEKTLENLNLEIKAPLNPGFCDAADNSFSEEEEVSQLVKYYIQIKDPTVKQTVLNLVKSLSGNIIDNDSTELSFPAVVQKKNISDENE